jgi:putative membrane protein
MTSFFKLLQWVLKAAVFFTLFAFALNNQHEASVHFFFGTQWRSPMVLVVLTAFALGIAVGVLGMVPRWWRHRQLARKAQKAPVSSTTTASSNPEEPLHGA